MASQGNQHCANCIGTVSFPIIGLQKKTFVVEIRITMLIKTTILTGWRGQAEDRERQVSAENGTWHRHQQVRVKATGVTMTLRLSTTIPLLLLLLTLLTITTGRTSLTYNKAASPPRTEQCMLNEWMNIHCTTTENATVDTRLRLAVRCSSWWNSMSISRGVTQSVLPSGESRWVHALLASPILAAKCKRGYLQNRKYITYRDAARGEPL